MDIVINKYYLGSFTNYPSFDSIEYVVEDRALPIVINGFEDIDMWILKENRDGGSYWRISESYCGFGLYYSTEPETKMTAIKNLLNDMSNKNITLDVLKKMINKNVKKWGLSPRYKKNK